MSLTEEDIKKISESEEKDWIDTYAAIEVELERVRVDYKQDEDMARSLTSQIVASTRDEDKAMLASDEAVAHGLTGLRRDESKGLQSLLKQPYFARVVTEEDGRRIEFKLGTASFPEKRIIDWRKGPISKLYYDYKEGEEFEETIQGREREGEIVLRRSYQGEKDNLFLIETSQGSLVKVDNDWQIGGEQQLLSRKVGHDGHLPSILSLITPEQFELITENPEQSIVIQGIAGSGKTTVALHRLAWLLHENNSPAKAENCLVVMFNRTLKNYVETTLPELEIHDVPIKTYYQWSLSILYELISDLKIDDLKFSDEYQNFKGSVEIEKWIRRYVTQNSTDENLLRDYWCFLKFIFSDKEFKQTHSQFISEIESQISQKKIQQIDVPILLSLNFYRYGYPHSSSKILTDRDHIMIDEAQDFTYLELLSLLRAVKKSQTVSIVGDPAQQIILGKSGFDWMKILAQSGFSSTPPVSLDISYRTTEEIMDLAEFVRAGDYQSGDHQSSGRHGDEAKFYRVDEEGTLVESISNWVEKCLQDFPHSLSAIICRYPKTAQEIAFKLRQMGFPSVRWGYRDKFDFSPGIVVTNVHQVKGLEFRSVLIVEPNENNYHFDNVQERNLLYVAITRAEERVDFIGFYEKTSILPELYVENIGFNPEEESEENIKFDQIDDENQNYEV